MNINNRNIYIDKLNLVRLEKNFIATICCCCLSERTDYEEVIPYLNSQELSYYNSLKFEKRIRSYLIGRFVAKQAVSALSGEEKLANIFIQSGVFRHPIVVSGGENIQVSITHSENFGAALAFPEAHPMGIDLEKINVQQRAALEEQVTQREKSKIASLSISYDMGLTMLWTVKEALSKVLKTGLMTPFEVFEICDARNYDNYILCYYKNFPQYKAISFAIRQYMCSIVYPLQTKLHFDTQFLLNTLKN